jgi:AcrR family transcriptional regulator
VRDALLEATQAILSEAGVARLSTKEVARRAGVAESSIFYHFGDRMGLLQAVVAAHLPLLKDVLVELDQRAGTGELRDNLVALLDAFEDFYLRTIPILAAVQADSELRMSFAARSGEFNIGPHRALDAVIGYLAKERDAGSLCGDRDLRAVALLLTGAAHQRALHRHLNASIAAPLLPATTDIVDILMPSLYTQA